MSAERATADPVDVLVADDEAPALRELAAFLRADERIGRVHEASTGAAALRVLSEERVDAAFLDIHMPGLSGIDLARALERFALPPAVVFVTADEARALEAFEVHALDYVLKPIRQSRLRTAVDRVVDARGRRGAGVEERAPEASDTLAVTVGTSVRLIRRADIAWVQAQGDYSRLHTPAGSHLARIALADLAERWPEFVRVHRSFLVRADAVTGARLQGPSPSVAVGGDDVPVSRRLVPAVRARLLRDER